MQLGEEDKDDRMQVYRKILIISPGLMLKILFKRLFCWTYFWVRLFLEGLVIGRNFVFQNGFGLPIKTAKKKPKITAQNSSRQPTKTVHGLIFGRAYYRKDICIPDLRRLVSAGVTLGGGHIVGILRYKQCSIIFINYLAL